MLDSIRVRLTLWYTLVLGLVLVVITGFSYLLYGRSLMQRTDAAIVELSSAFATTFNAELSDEIGQNGPRIAAREAMLEHRFRGTYFVLLDSSGDLLASSFDLPATEDPHANNTADFLSSARFRDFAAQPHPDPAVLRTVPGTRGGFRASARSITTSAGVYTLVVLQSLHPLKELLGDIRQTFYWVIPAALLLACIGGYFLARRSLAPVSAMASQVSSMGAAHLRHRLVVKNSRDELGQLAVAFNQLLERLETPNQLGEEADAGRQIG